MNSYFSMRTLHISLELWGSLFCLIVAYGILILKMNDKKHGRMLAEMELAVAVLIAVDALTWIFRGQPGTTGWWMVRISNGLMFFLSDIVPLCYHRYVLSFVTNSRQEDAETDKLPVWRNRLVYVVELFAAGMVIVSAFTGLYYSFDENNFYHRQKWYPMAILLPYIGMLIDISVIIQFRKKFPRQSWKALLAYAFLPMVAALIMLFYYGASLINLSICISGVLVFGAALIDQSHEAAEREKEIYDLQVMGMLSQIKPHFIYNTLTTIKYLCRKDPVLAMETIDEFAAYLRGNIDFLTSDKKIPFSQELLHVQNYLALEKKRFGESLRVEYAIETQDFYLPPLVLQPLVENAVKHGILKKEEGGTLKISTCRKKDGYYVTLEDDGVGFETGVKKQDDRQHVGIRNAKSRLESISHGNVMISSSPGTGTVVILRLPLTEGSIREK